MNMNGRMFSESNDASFNSEDIFKSVQGIVLSQLFTKIQCSTFYKDYFEQNFYL